MNSLILSGLLKRFYPDFSISNFENRLKLQKIIYLLQNKVVDLGFNFTLYLYGPYSTDLTKLAYYIDDFNKSTPIKFEEEPIEKKFTEFVKAISPYKNNVKWLECVATLHLFQNLYPTNSKNEIFNRIIDIKPKFDKNYLDKCLEEGKECQMLN